MYTSNYLFSAVDYLFDKRVCVCVCVCIHTHTVREYDEYC
jgi:hypothetical protein